MVRVDLKEENGSKFIQILQIASQFPQYATIDNDATFRAPNGKIEGAPISNLLC